MTLFEIHNAIRLIVADTPPDGELTDQQLDAIDRLSIDFETKADGYCSLYKEFTAEADAIEAEAKRMAARAESKRNEGQRLRERLALVMTNLGQPKVKTKRFTCWLQANPPSVKIGCPVEDLPDEFRRVKTVIEADKKAMIEASEAGKELPSGCEVVRGQHLRIK